jgi:lysophospholipase L1-like esterase
LLGPNIKLLVFDADSFNPQYDQLVRLSAENNIPFAAGLDAFVRQAEVAGECTRSEDGYHWNDRGNELVATFLKKEVERRLQEK